MNMPSKPTARPKQVSRYGITEDSPIPADLPFAAALRLLMADCDRYSIKIGIDPTAVLQEWPRHVILIGIPNELEILRAQSERMAFTLGTP